MSSCSRDQIELADTHPRRLNQPFLRLSGGTGDGQTRFSVQRTLRFATVVATTSALAFAFRIPGAVGLPWGDGVWPAPGGEAVVGGVRSRCCGEGARTSRRGGEDDEGCLLGFNESNAVVETVLYEEGLLRVLSWHCQQQCIDED